MAMTVAAVLLSVSAWPALGAASSTQKHVEKKYEKETRKQNAELDVTSKPEKTTADEVKLITDGVQQIRIISKTFKPPKPTTVWSFRKFTPAEKDEAALKAAEDKYNGKKIPERVDIDATPTDAMGLKADPDAAKKIRVRGVFPKPKHAGTFPLQCEGNLQRPKGVGVGKKLEPYWAAKVRDIKVEIIKPKGSLDADPNPLDSWLKKPCYHFDFQGVTSGSPGSYALDIEGVIEPSPPYTYKWTLDAAAGTLKKDTTNKPTHEPPKAPAPGTLTLTAMEGATSTSCTDTRRVKIYQDHLARDYENFGTNISCDGKWTFTRFNVTITMDHRWNCHGSVKHAYDGSGTGRSATTVSWTVTKTAGEGESLGTLNRGDVIAYYDKDGALMHSQTVLSGTTTHGANNKPPPGGPGTQSWVWATSTAGEWALSVPATYKPITIKVMPRP